jgi:2-iminobutanoate/2-iminopropanoate deaminase
MGSYLKRCQPGGIDKIIFCFKEGHALNNINKKTMTETKMIMNNKQILVDLSKLTEGERVEMTKLGMLSVGSLLKDYNYPAVHKDRPPVGKVSVHAPDIINEAYDYKRPSSFSRALRLDFGEYKVLLISGTASVNEEGKAEHIGDFKAQTWRTYRNITNLLAAEGMTWHDVVRTTNYLRDIERDYEDFNKIRTTFFRWMNLDPLPASTGIQARLCWETLLVEIEVYAVCKMN